MARWPGRLAIAGLLAMAGFAWSRTARADIFAYVDHDGSIHITNIAGDPRSRPFPLTGKKNSYSWRDKLGALRTIHRVDVTDYDPIILEASRYYSLPPQFVKAVIAAESSFEPAAVSHAGAQGLMQLIPQTAHKMYVQDPFDPRENIYGGTRYLRVMANLFAGDLRSTIAAYNAGPKAVTKANGVPNFDETRRYVNRVLTLYRHYLETWSPGAS